MLVPSHNVLHPVTLVQGEVLCHHGSTGKTKSVSDVISVIHIVGYVDGVTPREPSLKFRRVCGDRRVSAPLTQVKDPLSD